MAWHPAGVAGLLLTLAGVACHNPSNSAETQAAVRSGIRVPLPAGWSFRAVSDRVLLVGTPEHSVMRIEVLPAEGELPSPLSLASEFQKHLHGVSVRVESQQARADTSLVFLELKPADSKQAGALADAPHLERVLLAAKRLGGSLFLCATEPGASAEDVRVAAAACEGLSSSS
jgi:hypothetical protein